MELFVDAAMAKGQVEIMSTTRSVVLCCAVDVVEESFERVFQIHWIGRWCCVMCSLLLIDNNDRLQGNKANNTNDVVKREESLNSKMVS